MYRKNTQKILPLSLINTANTKNITPISYQHCKFKIYYPYLLSTLQIQKYYPYLLPTLQIQKILPLSLINTANTKLYIIFVTLKM